MAKQKIFIKDAGVTVKLKADSKEDIQEFIKSDGAMLKDVVVRLINLVESEKERGFR